MSKRIPRLILLWLVVSLASLVQAGNIINMPGTFTWQSYSLDGANGETYNAWEFTHYDAALAQDLHGIVVIPNGEGPFPSVLVSHGKGSDAKGFGEIKAADWFAPAGYLVIAVDYTHAGKVNCSQQPCGGSEENVARASLAFDVLSSQQLIDQMGDIVDQGALFAYGNSMGAFVTEEYAQTVHNLKAIGLTAGGVYREQDTLLPLTPHSVAGIEMIDAPVMQLHGLNDRTVPPAAANTLSGALDDFDKIHQMVWYTEGEHNIHELASAGEFIIAWFNSYRIDANTQTDATPYIQGVSYRTDAAGNLNARLSGRHFGHNAYGENSIHFNAEAATLQHWGDTTVQVAVPAGVSEGYVEAVVPVGPLDNTDIEHPVSGGLRSNRPAVNLPAL